MTQLIFDGSLCVCFTRGLKSDRVAASQPFAAKPPSKFHTSVLDQTNTLYVSLWNGLERWWSVVSGFAINWQSDGGGRRREEAPGSVIKLLSCVHWHYVNVKRSLFVCARCILCFSADVAATSFRIEVFVEGSIVHLT
jgi:hypothetical protein